MTHRTRPVGASAAPRGRPAFLQGKIPGATSPKGPAVQARAVFGGVAPAPPAVRLRGPGRPDRIANRLADRALPHLRLVRSGRKSCPDTTPGSVRLAIFPARAGANSCASRTTAREARERVR